MRALSLLPVAALFAALAACGDSTTAPAPAPPLDPGRFDATFDGGLGGAGIGTAYTYDLSWAAGSPLIWLELRDERVPTRNTLIRFLIHGAGLPPGRHAVGGSAAENPLDAVALEFQAGATVADVKFVGFTGSVDVEEANAAGGVRGSFDVRTGALHAKGRFNAVVGPF
ncbi:MAG TPA: hypothetical protein VGO40_07305 [Longimicrobium sp.]|jgi:hypothetical protein|nr:hypothetical protein [Longimicrobium sp.]